MHDQGHGYPWDCPVEERQGLKCRFGEVRFAKVFHLVRFPLKAIASLDTYSPVSWEFVNAVTDVGPGDPLLSEDARVLRNARHWVMWNKFVGFIADRRFQIEGLNPSKVCHSAGFQDRCDATPKEGVLLRPNNRPHQPLTWERLEALDPVLTATIKQMTLEYGYTLDNNATTEVKIE